MASTHLDLAGEVMKYGACPDAANALRHGSAMIIRDWEAAVRRSVPGAQPLSSLGLLDCLPALLEEIAGLLETPTHRKADKLIESSPEHGLARFEQDYQLRELFDEELLLRSFILRNTEAGLARPITIAENTLLNLIIDIAMRGAAFAFVARQQQELRSQAEVELKGLSFLSHDMNNNLSAVMLHLRLLEDRLLQLPNFPEEIAALELAQQSITRTTEGMRRILLHERLRRQEPSPHLRAIDLHKLAQSVADQYSEIAKANELSFSVVFPTDATAYSDYELVALVLQNLVHNAAKYTRRAAVRIIGEYLGEPVAADWQVSVHDEGPGIPSEHLTHIFVAFQRASATPDGGLGLGLAIASQAARLLGGRLSVESQLGAGSRFTLTLPRRALPEGHS